MSSEVTVAVVSTLGGVLVAYITVKYKDRIVTQHEKEKPKDRMETIFDGYENLIKQQQADINRKQQQLDTTQQIINRLQDELNTTREIVKQQQVELQESKEMNKELVNQLEQMKTQYTSK